MQTQNGVLGYKIELFFHDYKLAIEVDKNGHSDRNIDYEIKRQKTIEQEFGCELIRIDPDKEYFNIFNAISEIFRSSIQLCNQLTKDTVINKISMRLLRLEFKSDNTIKANAIKYIVEKILPNYDTSHLILLHIKQ